MADGNGATGIQGSGGSEERWASYKKYTDNLYKDKETGAVNNNDGNGSGCCLTLNDALKENSIWCS